MDAGLKRVGSPRSHGATESEIQRARHFVNLGCEPDLLGLSESAIRRRVVRSFGRLPSDPEERAACEEIIKLNEADMRLAVAIDQDLIEDDAKSSAQERLERRLTAAVERLSPGLREQLFNNDALAPVWLDGSVGSWVEIIRLLPDLPAPAMVVARPRERRTRRVARTSGSRGDPDPEPHDDVVRRARRRFR